MLRLSPLAWLTSLFAVMLLVSGCSETRLTAHTAKELQKRSPHDGLGSYKVGNPYQINGVWYYPQVDYNYNETGIASWYGPGFHGRRTANGEIYDQNDLTAAHPTLPMPSLVRVTNLENGRSIKLRVNDRGPFASGRIIDVSQRGAQLLGFREQGTAKVRVELLEAESLQLAALAQGKEIPPAERAQPAPVEAVAVEGLAGGEVRRVRASAPQVAERPAAEIPAPDGVVTVQPVSTSDIFVQAGAFTLQDNAARLAASLSGLGPVRVSPVQVRGMDFYRVQLGPLANVDDADRLLAALVANGYTDSRVIVQ